MRIALDGLGGDSVEAECASALQSFFSQTPDADVSIALATTRQHFDSVNSQLPSGLGHRLMHLSAEGVIGFEESPVQSLKQKPRASINVAMAAVEKGQAEAVVSFGHTGASVVAAQLKLGLLAGVDRAGLGAIVPNRHGMGLLMDVGANIKSRPEHLNQYGLMADVYCRSVLKIPQPRIGLLNVGEEKGKGDERLQAAFQLMEQADYHFVGNVEGGQIFDGSVDAVICNGLEGNMVLKSAESLANMLFESIGDLLERERGVIKGKTRWGISSLSAKHDPDSRGASRLLGVQGLVLIGHGNAKREAIVSALKSAMGEVRLGLQPALAVRLTDH